MKQIAYIISAGTLISTLVLACSDDSSGGGGGTFAGEGGTTSVAGKGGSTNNAGKGGANNNAGKGGASNTTGGAGGDPNTFGGGGETQGGSDQGGAGQGGGGQADPCDACALSKCGTQISGCENSPDCAAILQCRQQCADQACADKCVTDNPGGKTAFEAAVQCVGGQCASECNTSSGNACQMCQQAKCSTELTSCGSDQACNDALKCLNACQDQACVDGCVAQSATLGKLVTCVQDQCASDCVGGGGGDVKCTQIGLGDNGGPCDMCGHSKCCAQIEACFNDDNCNAFNKCLGDNNCKDQACFDSCAATNQAGAQLFSSLGQCIQTSCMNECQ